MVRPRERYRHGARRRGPQLVPVYFVTEVFDSYNAATNVGLNRSVTIHTGTDGLVATFNPWQLEPLPLASADDPGLVSAMISEITKVANRTITSSSWSGTQYNSISQGFELLLNGVLYCTFVRTSLYVGAATVSYSQTFPGTPLPPSSGSLSEINVLSNSSYDVLTVGVDLTSGQLSSNSAPLYSHALSFDGNPNYQYSARYDATYHGYKEAVAASLPDGHPFKTCGIEAWNYLSNLGADPGDYGQDPSGLPSLSNPLLNTFDPFRIAHPSLFAVARQPLAAQQRLQRLKGYTADAQQRVYGDGYYEWSTLLQVADSPTSWTTCAGLAVLGAQVASTWSDYSPEALTAREELLDLGGLAAEDQTKQLEDPTSTPIESFTPSGPSQYVTADPVYFRETSNRPSFAGSSVVRYLSRHYWINS